MNQVDLLIHNLKKFIKFNESENSWILSVPLSHDDVKLLINQIEYLQKALDQRDIACKCNVHFASVNSVYVDSSGEGRARILDVPELAKWCEHSKPNDQNNRVYLLSQISNAAPEEFGAVLIEPSYDDRVISDNAYVRFTKVCSRNSSLRLHSDVEDSEHFMVMLEYLERRHKVTIEQRDNYTHSIQSGYYCQAQQIVDSNQISKLFDCWAPTRTKALSQVFIAALQ